MKKTLKQLADFPYSFINRIIESKNDKFPVGSIVFSQSGWRTHTIVQPDALTPNEFTLLPDFGNASYSLAAGACGMPGNTAYFGFLEICQPKEGETVVVSGAAGAVGSLVGQIAKIKGCKVVGIAGSDKKCRWLEKELGFDKAINYKTANVSNALKEAAPKGYDCYFDNVGGEISQAVIEQMKLFGRISVCGAISGYNDQKIVVPAIQAFFIWKQLKMEGFIVHRWIDRWMEGVTQMLEWINSGKIKTEETVTEGFQNMPQAFIDMLNGNNTGKAIVKNV
jgi:prostaglandin reductase 1